MTGNSRLHAPHLPTSEGCFAGMRLDLPQEAQFRISGMNHFRPDIACTSVRMEVPEKTVVIEAVGLRIRKTPDC
jgi:hypothetical protein